MRNFVVIIDWVEEFEVKLEDSSTLFQTDKTQERNLQIKLCRFQNDAEFLHVVLEKKSTSVRSNQPAHRWMKMTPKMSTLRRLLINFRFMILHRKTFSCFLSFWEVSMLLRLFIYAKGKEIHHKAAVYTSVAINDKLLPRCFPS